MSTAVRTSLIALVAVAGAGMAGYHFVPPVQSALDSVIAKAEATVAAISGNSASPVLNEVEEGRTYAQIGDFSITGADIETFMSNLPENVQASTTSEMLPLVVNQMVNDYLVLQAARAEGLHQDPELQARINFMKDQLIREAYVNSKIEDNLTDRKLKARFDEMVSEIPETEEVRARHILVSTEDQAKDLIERLNNGEDFVELATQFSEGPSAQNGGDLNFFSRDMMVKEFSDAAFALDNGQYTQTPVQTQFGYHIILREDDRTRPMPEFEALKPQIRNQVVQEMIQGLIEDLRASNNVEFNLPENMAQTQPEQQEQQAN